jgi:hypothetical protein
MGDGKQLRIDGTVDGGEHRRYAKPIDGFLSLAFQRGHEARWVRTCQTCGASIEAASPRFCYEWAIGHSGACKQETA